LNQHKKSFQHSSRVHSQSSSRQRTLNEVTGQGRPEQSFEKYLVEAFLAEGIPLRKLESGPLRKVFDKCCSYKVPSVSTLRRVVPDLCDEHLKKAKEDIGNSRIWISVDEATDPVGRNIANIVIGKLDRELPEVVISFMWLNSKRQTPQQLCELSRMPYELFGKEPWEQKTEFYFLLRIVSLTCSKLVKRWLFCIRK
jgi:hypothetical protein